MELSEIREKRKNLEMEILRLIKKFEEETGLIVNKITKDPIKYYDENSPSDINIEVKNPF